MGKIIGKSLHRPSLSSVNSGILGFEFSFFPAPTLSSEMFAQFRVSENKFPNFTPKTRPTKKKMCFHQEDDDEGRVVPSGQTSPDGPSVLPSDRFLPPRLTWPDRSLSTRDSTRQTVCTDPLIDFCYVPRFQLLENSETDHLIPESPNMDPKNLGRKNIKRQHCSTLRGLPMSCKVVSGVCQYFCLGCGEYFHSQCQHFSVRKEKYFHFQNLSILSVHFKIPFLKKPISIPNESSLTATF